MEESLFEQVGGTYTQVGDYLLPNLTLTEEAQKSIGIGGQQHARYLKQYHKVNYYNYLTSGKLNAILPTLTNKRKKCFHGWLKIWLISKVSLRILKPLIKWRGSGKSW